MALDKMMERNMDKLRKDLDFIINFKTKIMFFVLSSKYKLEDLEDMNIKFNKIDIVLKGEKKSFLIDKKFYAILRKLKIMILEQKEVEDLFKNNPQIAENIVKVKEDIENKELTFDKKDNLASATGKIEKALEEKIDYSKIEFKFRYREYTFDN